MRDLLERITTDFSLLDRKAIFAFVYTGVGLTGIFYLKNSESLAGFLRGTKLENVGDFVTAGPITICRHSAGGSGWSRSFIS